MCEGCVCLGRGLCAPSHTAGPAGGCGDFLPKVTQGSFGWGCFHLWWCFCSVAFWHRSLRPRSALRRIRLWVPGSPRAGDGGCSGVLPAILRRTAPALACHCPGFGSFSSPPLGPCFSPLR